MRDQFLKTYDGLINVRYILKIFPNVAKTAFTVVYFQSLSDTDGSGNDTATTVAETRDVEEFFGEAWDGAA